MKIDTSKLKEISLEEHKKIQLEILLCITDFCDKHNLRYYLAFGTLIGAIRHKGFIPWDDDTDIQMPKEDYEELIKIFNKENTNDHIMLIDPRSDIAKHAYVKAIDTRTIKIEQGMDYDFFLGADIDIFPINGMPEDDLVYKKWLKKIQWIYAKRFYTTTTFKGSLLHKCALIVRRFPYHSKLYWYNRAEKMHEMYPLESCNYAGIMVTYFSSDRNRVPKSCFDDCIIVDFEGHKFKAPVGYDTILTNVYGDYMTPPEDTTSTHIMKVYWKEGF